VSKPQLYLITPRIDAPEPFAPPLTAACGAGGLAAILLRLKPADERTLINRVKSLAAIVQRAEAALLISVDEETLDLPTIAARGGADGVHATAPAQLRELRERSKGDRILGAGNLRSKHEAMEAGEAGVDYLLFGEPRRDDSVPPLDGVIERAAWWAEIFETPCVAYAPTLEAVPALAATRAEFVALGNAVWTAPAGPADALSRAQAALSGAESAP
jgi:thiamine-phosphate pyrophosphorylase